MKHLFAVTTWLIILLAAGMASQGAAFLVQADLLPPLEDAVWDTSWVLTDSSILGKTLHTLVGYSAQPSGTQLIFYTATLTVIGSAHLPVSIVDASLASSAARGSYAVIVQETCLIRTARSRRRPAAVSAPPAAWRVGFVCRNERALTASAAMGNWP